MNKFSFKRAAIALLWSLLYLGIFLGAQVLVSLAYGFIIPFRVASAHPSLETEQLLALAEKELMSSVGMMTIISGIITIAVFWLIIYFRKRPLEGEMGLYRVPFTSLLSVSVLAITAVWGVSLVFSLLPESWLVGYGEDMNMYMDESAAMFLSIVVFAPIVEEITFRSMIYGTLSRAMPAWAAMPLSSLIFAIMHGNLLQMVYVFFLGLLLSWVYHRYRSVVPCIMLHLVFNLFGSYSAQMLNSFGDGYSTVLLAALVFTIPAVMHIMKVTSRRRN